MKIIIEKIESSNLASCKFQKNGKNIDWIKLSREEQYFCCEMLTSFGSLFTKSYEQYEQEDEKAKERERGGRI